MRRVRGKGITLLACVAVLALVLSTVAVVTLVRQASQREHDRIAADLAGCERGNEFRQQVRDIGAAGAQLDQDVLARIYDFAGLDPDEERAIRDLLEPAFESYAESVASVQDTDCSGVISGAP